jgi:hypothetical protein
VEPAEGKVSVRRKKQADLIANFLDKAQVYDMSTNDIVDTLMGLTAYCIIEQARPGYEDVTEALYLKDLKDIFARAKETKRAKS